jgi:hypothetical protein|uniref:Zinc finger and BTB domain-containing protein 8A.1-A n=1 Tax=Sipha flava TaxID=143950 RepID=A0A2S2Q8G5_9HEMI
MLPKNSSNNSIMRKYININFIMFTDLHYQYTLESNSLRCPNFCGRLYSGTQRKKNLKKHLKLECGVAPMFLCKICTRKFTRKENLKRHIILTHKTFKNTLHNCMLKVTNDNIC